MMSTHELKKPLFWIHVGEVVLGVVCLALIINEDYEMVYSDKDVDDFNMKRFLVYTAYFGMLFVSVTVVISYIVDEKIEKILNIIIALLGAALYCTAGAFNVEAFSEDDDLGQVLAAGIIAICCAVLYLIDLVITIIKMFKKKKHHH